MNVTPLAERIRETRGRLSQEQDFPKITDTDMNAAVAQLQTMQKSGIGGSLLRERVIGFMRGCGYGDFNGTQAEILIPLLEGMAQLRETAQVDG